MFELSEEEKEEVIGAYDITAEMFTQVYDWMIKNFDPDIYSEDLGNDAIRRFGYTNDFEYVSEEFFYELAEMIYGEL